MRLSLECFGTSGQRRGAWLGLSLLWVAQLACVTATPGTTPEVNRVGKYTSTDQSFTCEIPEGWGRAEAGHPYGDLTPIFGVRLTGPMGQERVAITISVLHYSGEGLFHTPDDFIRRQLNSMVRTDHDQETPIITTTVAGRPARAFQIKTFKLVFLPNPERPPMREGVMYEWVPPHNQVGLMERYLVLPASKGYFVLGYSAPEQMFEEHRELFERTVGSFQPHLP